MSAYWTGRPLRGAKRWRNSYPIRLQPGEGEDWHWRMDVDRARLERWARRGVDAIGVELDGRHFCTVPMDNRKLMAEASGLWGLGDVSLDLHLHTMDEARAQP